MIRHTQVVVYKTMYVCTGVQYNVYMICLVQLHDAEYREITYRHHMKYIHRFYMFRQQVSYKYTYKFNKINDAQVFRNMNLTQCTGFIIYSSLTLACYILQESYKFNKCKT